MKKLPTDQLNSLFFDLSHDAQLVLDEFLKIQSANNAFLSLFGLSLEEAKNLHFCSLLYSEDHDLLQDVLKKAQLQNAVSEVESFPLIRFQGKMRETHYLSVTIRWLANERIYLFAGADRSQEHLKSAALAKIESTSKIGCWEIDLLASSVHWSDQVYRIHDLDPRSFHPSLNDSIQFFDQESLPIVSFAVDKLLTSGQPYDLKLKIITGTGQLKWVRATAQAELLNAKVVRCFGTFQDINLEKIQEDELRVQAERFKVITDNVPIMIGEFSSEGMLRWTNATWAKELGSPFDEETSSMHNLRKLIDSSSLGWTEGRIHNFNRSLIDTRWWKIELSEGKSIAIGKDVTSEKKLMGRILAKSNQLELAMRVGGVGTIELSTIEGVAQFSHSWCSMLGLNPKTTLQHLSTWELVTDADDWKNLWRELEKCLHGETDFFQGVYQMKRQTGETIQVYHRGQIVEKTEQDIPVKMIVLTLDISKEREIQDELHRANQETKKLFEVSLDPMCIADLNGKLKRVNPAFLRALDISVAELLSRSIFDFVHPDDQAATKVQARKLSSGVPVAQFENRCRHKNGSYRIFSWNVSPDLESRRLYCSLIDVTEKREAELRLVQSSKMASLGEMAGGIAHEINNPLTIIQGKARQVQKVLSKSPLNLESVHQDLEKICGTTERIAKIVRGLRTFSRDSEKDPLTSHGIVPLIEECFDLCREKFKFQEVSISLTGDVTLTAFCRPTQVSQVILNLLHNSLDATQSLEVKWVEVLVSAQEDFLEITITDSGPGIPPAIADKIMEPFFTTKEPGKGTGLGLSLSRSIVNDQGGEFFLDKQHLNTRFVIRLKRSLVATGDKAA